MIAGEIKSGLDVPPECQCPVSNEAGKTPLAPSPKSGENNQGVWCTRIANVQQITEFRIVVDPSVEDQQVPMDVD
jgi:hypothetical protein